MKFLPVCLTGLHWLLILMMTPTGFCIDCQWGPWGGWSECNPCTREQTRSRVMVVYAQFELGRRCSGGRTWSRTCETTQGCPLDQGCGGRFRCQSGMCIDRSLVCNGDQDCEGDNLDEHSCDQPTRYVECEGGRAGVPPNLELTGKGYDIVSGMPMQGVINTKSFGGQCRINLNNNYRLPLSTLNVNFMVEVKNGFSEDSYESKWHYAKDIVNRQTVTGTTKGFKNYDYHEKVDTTKKKKLLVLENDVEVAQFQNNAPQYLPISEAFWKVLAKLPNVYDYAAYRKVLERFGTHYLSEGSFGGSFKAFLSIDEETYKHTVHTKQTFQECTTVTTWIFFIPFYKTTCDHNVREGSHPPQDETTKKNQPLKLALVGGGVSHIAALETKTSFDDTRNTWQLYSNWAASIQDFPTVIKRKLRPLSELVKEVQCAGLKKHYLRRATEQYQAEYHPCHCRPCTNNGLAVMKNDVCECVCKKGTYGDDCDLGTYQEGVIDGSWTCWSSWTACSGGRRSRTRSCSNPAPRTGGQHCIGEPKETSNCDDQELEYLKTMEPQCFDLSLAAKERCGVPPILINGYVLDPKDVYLVGSRVEYTCTDRYHLTGTSILECTADQTWSGRPGICTLSKCRIKSINEGITATPRMSSYDIGMRITLSCPKGRQIRGEREMICDPSLNFSPDPANTECSEVITHQQQQQQQQHSNSTLQCKAWEKSIRGKCVCKIPNECSSSLEVCARNPGRGTTAVLSVCKMHALQCIGRDHLVAENSACQWRERASAPCSSCSLWETCDDQTGLCRCKDSAECSSPGMSVCVRVGNDVTAGNQTMSECEAGLRRCKGEQVSVVSILSCEE